MLKSLDDNDDAAADDDWLEGVGFEGGCYTTIRKQAAILVQFGNQWKIWQQRKI